MKNKMALRNMVINLLLQFTVAVSGIILPRFFLEAYGSSVNGMITSISQFLSYVSLVEAGVGAAATVALYKPLAQEDQDQINAVMCAAARFYRRSGISYVVLACGVALLYPLLIGGQIDYTQAAAMVLVLASTTAVDFLILGKYRVLLTADQRNYVVGIAQMIGTVLTLVLSILCIKLGFSALVVKIVASGVFILRVFMVYLYVKRHYPELSLKGDPKGAEIPQRWDALFHQIVGALVLNAGVILLTLFSGADSLKEVSVYTTYNMVAQMLYLVLNSFSTALSAGFGHMLISESGETVAKSYDLYEYLYSMVLHVAYVCAGVLLLPFISIYTQGITDTNYYRISVAVLFLISGYARDVRIPSLTMILAAGHYKQTKGRAALEAAINLTVSFFCVFRFGIEGVLLGAAASFLYRSTDCILYTCKRITHQRALPIFARTARNLALSLVLVVLGNLLLPTIGGFVGWFLAACVVGVISLGCFVLTNALAEPTQFRRSLEQIRNLKSGSGPA